MAVIQKNQLLEAGSHFGHNVRRWDPRMKEYIFGERSGIFIIDLDKTVEKIEEAYKALMTIVQNGGKVLFVGTRKQTQEVIKEEATRAGMYYVDQRWLGGTLTNFKTIKKSIARLFQIEGMEADGTFDVLPKKEVFQIKKEKAKLDKNFGGIKEMTAVPQAIVIVDPKTEHNAVTEARKLSIPIFAIVDTNCNPEEIDHVIPANDDAIRSVKLIIGTLANACVEATGGTPITIEFTNEPEAEEHPRRERNPRFGNRGGRGGSFRPNSNGYRPRSNDAPREYVKRVRPANAPVAVGVIVKDDKATPAAPAAAAAEAPKTEASPVATVETK